jgi:fatty-acyl-CoA synthase
MEAVLSYSSGPSERALIGETIGANLARTVATHGTREAVVDVASGRRQTYEQFAEAVDDLALGLLAGGLSRGDRIGIWSPNVLEWMLVQYATARLGAILVNVNPAYRAYELEYVLNQSGASMLISATTHKTSDYQAMWTWSSVAARTSIRVRSRNSCIGIPTSRTSRSSAYQTPNTVRSFSPRSDCAAARP